VAQDKLEAYMWLSLAAAGGQGDALLQRYRVAHDMSQEQITTARRLTEAFSPHREGGTADSDK
jgi:hypothetical protein